MKDKDLKTILQTLAPLADRIILSRPHTERASSPGSLLRELGSMGKKAEVIEDLSMAIEKGLSLTRPGDLFGITGSLYTVGEARDYLLPGGGA
jgi:dihydrofolate synthase/folylpolyglutamate synthase